MKKLLVTLPFIIISQMYAITQTDAIKLYNAKKYKQAYNAFLELLEKDNYQSNVLNFYFAKSAEKIGNYKEALGAIERILINDPTDLLAQFERAKIYYILKDYKSAKQYFTNLEQKIKNKKLKSDMKKYLASIEKLQKKNFLYTTFLFTLGYDSNMNNTTDTEKWNLYVPDGAVEVKNNSHIKDSYTTEELLFLKYRHKFNNFDVDNSLLALSKQYTTSHNSDINFFRYSPSIIFTKNKLRYETKFNYSYVIYGNNYMLSLYSLEENIKYKYTPTILNTTTIKAENKIYTQEYTNKNATLYSISNKTDKKIKNSLVSILFGYDRNIKHKGTLATVNYVNYKTALSFKHNYTNKLILFTSLQFEDKKYSEEYNIFKKTQEDKKISFNIKLTKKLKHFDLQTEYKYTRNDSNIAPFDYSKYNINVSLIKNIKGL